jgi:hypothetical protein
MTHFSLTALPAIRYASDMPFSVGMVLADDEGRTVEVTHVGPTYMALSGYVGSSIRHRVVRVAYPYLVFVTEMAADAEAREAEAREWSELLAASQDGLEAALTWLERDIDNVEEDARVEALAEAAQHEDDLRQAVLDRAAAEWERKNRGIYGPEHAFYGREHAEFFLDEVEHGGARYEKAATGQIADLPW